MKRSGNVSLAVMGTAAFAMTFAGGMTYLNWSRPSHASPQTAASTCTPKPEGTCERTSRGFMFYLLPSFGSSSSNAAPAKPAQSAALTSKPRATTPAVSPSGTTRGGFGTTASSSSFRTSSAGG